MEGMKERERERVFKKNLNHFCSRCFRKINIVSKSRSNDLQFLLPVPKQHKILFNG